jgi:hypothetical protein
MDQCESEIRVDRGTLKWEAWITKIKDFDVLIALVSNIALDIKRLVFARMKTDDPLTYRALEILKDIPRRKSRARELVDQDLFS